MAGGCIKRWGLLAQVAEAVVAEEEVVVVAVAVAVAEVATVVGVGRVAAVQDVAGRLVGQAVVETEPTGVHPKQPDRLRQMVAKVWPLFCRD